MIYMNKYMEQKKISVMLHNGMVKGFEIWFWTLKLSRGTYNLKPQFKNNWLQADYQIIPEVAKLLMESGYRKIGRGNS